MTSQNNYSRDSINKISNYILSEQNIDILNFTSGHLNENHLWKPPEQKNHKPWMTDTLPKQNSQLKIRSSKNKGLTDQSESNMNAPSEKISLSELKSPKLSGNTLSFKTATEFETKLPKIRDKNPDVMSSFPITDKEMALNILNSHFKGASKEEKFNNLTNFEKKILKKDDLAAHNTLHGK
jgi:hypothetical protein